MRRLGIALVTYGLVLVMPTDAAGQRLPDVRSGSRIRLISSSVADSWLLGELVLVDDVMQTLRFQVDGGANQIVRLPDITKLQVQSGTRSLGGAGLGWGAVIDGAIGAVLFALVYDDGGDFRKSDLALIGAGAGVLTGGVICGVLGSAFRVPKWSAVEFR